MSNNLQQIWSEARSKWNSSRNIWNDEARTKFDTFYLIPLEQQANAIIKIVDNLEQSNHRLQNELKQAEDQRRRIEQSINELMRG